MMRNPYDAAAAAWEHYGATEPRETSGETGVVSRGRTAFPLACLPPVMARHIGAAARAMDADAALIACPALSAFAGAIGATATVEVKPGWREPCALWVGVVALPSSMKSEGMRLATGGADAADRDAARIHARAMAEFEDERARRAADRKGKKGTPEPELKPPARVQFVVSDTTPEALAAVLQANPRGVFARFDELGAMFGGFGRYNPGANAAEPGAAFYKSAFTGATFTSNRKGSDGRGQHLRLDRPLVSVGGAIQPEALKRVLLRQYLEDGLASRFLWAWPRDRAAGWSDAPTDDSARQDFEAAHRRLLDAPVVIDEGTGEVVPLVVRLSPEAVPLARAWVDGSKAAVESLGDGALRAAWGKLKGTAFRLALVLHLVERDGGPVATISADTLSRAIQLAEWFAGEAVRVYRLIGETDGDAERRRLADHIGRQGGSMTPRELARTYAPLRNDTASAEAALRDLAEAGIGEWVTTTGELGGAPRVALRLFDAPSPDARHNLENPPENEGSVAPEAPGESDSADPGGWGRVAE